tara:strand:- start:360 stop:896 length:537 start_codon:yes stop_codon:yes gene_type:complete
MYNYTKEQVLRAVNICDVAEKFQITLINANIGNFTHKCKCPYKDHKHGSERTDSLFIDAKNNNFYCFGCGANYNVIDFYLLCGNVSFADAIANLRLMVDPEKVCYNKYVSKESNYKILLDISSVFRTYIHKYPEDIDFIIKIMKRTDSYLSKINSDEIEKSSRLLSKVKFFFKERYDK